MLGEYGIQPWQVRRYTASQLAGMRRRLQERDGGDD